MKKPLKNFIVVKEIRAVTIGKAIKDEKKGEIVNVYEKPQESPPEQLAPAIGFYAQPDHEEDDA
jgi:hypothetical protein